MQSFKISCFVLCFLLQTNFDSLLDFRFGFKFFSSFFAITKSVNFVAFYLVGNTLSTLGSFNISYFIDYINISLIR